MPAELDAKIQM